ncbi:ATP-binding cassette domain-containing protein [Pedobacter gandavensis]|uniref:ABC transporter ATP-binding protein n=1 Tax=Pedobacter gandavensis TaxID=2679963 RepID=UPI00247A29EC|nr:ATP-binding cassette domain-containing protein [Pedobacter gandavensis]WGQ08581.1 ATP-binding cassette domain-containing protein [Pedobacter gandavensis]
MLHFEKFKKFYQGRQILSVPSLTLVPGIYWLKGSNGSGKSTLLKAIAGLLSFEGEIILHPQIALKKQSIAYRRLVNFAEAEPIFPAFLTGKEMIQLFSTAKGHVLGQTEYYLESMQMQHYMDQQIGTYSSGMLKKLSLVLAFIGKPELILLDEPLITIDAESLAVLYRWILEKNQQEGTSFLLASHQELEHPELSKASVLQVIEGLLKS